ncbi:hypothetical protein SVIOM342S_09355 [Streptomyces violaceorubidus]
MPGRLRGPPAHPYRRAAPATAGGPEPGLPQHHGPGGAGGDGRTTRDTSGTRRWPTRRRRRPSTVEEIWRLCDDMVRAHGDRLNRGCGRTLQPGRTGRRPGSPRSRGARWPGCCAAPGRSCSTDAPSGEHRERAGQGVRRPVPGAGGGQRRRSLRVLRARRKIFGALTLARAAGGPPFTQEDLTLVDDLVHGLALGVDTRPASTRTPAPSPNGPSQRSRCCRCCRRSRACGWPPALRRLLWPTAQVRRGLVRQLRPARRQHGALGPHRLDVTGHDLAPRPSR